jgi:AcrR family transcriptional regulator
MRVTTDTKNATRKRILDEAQRLFGRQGFDATTTRDLARSAEIAVGTLFNYFPTKESIVDVLIGEACMSASEGFAAAVTRDGVNESKTDEALGNPAEQPSLEEDLFAYVAVILRKLKPYRKYLPVVLDTSLSPLAVNEAGDRPSLRAAHLETVCQIASRHGLQDALTTLAIQMYWTLFTGILAFWAKDRSPRQEDSLALVDQSLSMFAGWLTTQANHLSNEPE